ncbi:hypothetical protein BJ170DRAFT_587171 [Xylariales sp. AK1849]|nr:hypothetical protein BJ170DRAFT_587171 [Xylariales sp. AK1849]
MADRNPVPRSSKRLRLGTKSCSECRRRKVRCIVPEGNQSCQECALHGALCMPQEPKASVADPTSPTELQARLDRLERIFHDICVTAGYADSGPSRTTNALSPEPIARCGSNQHHHLDHPDRLVSSQNSPLLRFFIDSMLIADCSSNSTLSPRPPRVERLIASHMRRLEVLIPIPSSLTAILQSTQKYWALWPLHPRELSQLVGLSVSVVSVARSFIHESIESNEPGRMAKAMVWLALCLQQLPKECGDKVQPLPSSAAILVFTYLDESDTLLNLDSELGSSISALECLILQSKCYVNMGRPRRAWKCIRRALNAAIFLGLHHTGNAVDTRNKTIWATIWRYDRQLSLILGFPHALPESHPSLTETNSTGPIEARIMHRMSIICGHIIDRNQDHQRLAYSTTVQIDEKMEDIKRMIPVEWWDLNHEEHIPLEVFFGRQTIKLYFYQLKKLLHLPYMIRAFSQRRYEYSRASVLDAAEGMIQCYRNTRRHPDGPIVICFLLDFQAFSAGMILATDLISQRSTWALEIEKQKWEMILGLIADLRRTATLLDYSVAEQGAQLLGYLYEARHGTYGGPETYEATVPYFGRVSIRRPTPRLSKSTTVEVSSNIFNYHQLSDPQLESELDLDWTAVFDENCTYDWNGVFDFQAASTI